MFVGTSNGPKVAMIWETLAAASLVFLGFCLGKSAGASSGQRGSMVGLSYSIESASILRRKRNLLLETASEIKAIFNPSMKSSG